MNDHKIAFIIATNDDQYLRECSYYINCLRIPDGFETDIITIREANSICEAYNAGMHSSDALYKVYLHQDVFILNSNFIQDTLDAFSLDENVGLLGIIGAKTLPTDANAYNCWDVGGTLLFNGEDGGISMHENKEGLNYVAAIDGMLMVTNRDVEWREDIFDGWDFYDLSHSMEFTDKGYKIAVPHQKSPWCFHDVGHLGLARYEHYRKTFCETYGEKYGFDIRCDKSDPFIEEYKKNKDTAHKMSELIYRDMKHGRLKRALEKYPYIKLCRIHNDNDQDILRELLIIHRNEINEKSCTFWARGSEYEEVREKYINIRFLLYRAQFDRPVEDYVPQLKAGLMSQEYTVAAVISAIDKYILDRTKVYERLISEGLPIGKREERKNFICPVCGNETSVLTFANSNKKVRKKHTFAWWTAAYTGESEKEVHCASCGASIYERLAALLIKSLSDRKDQRVALLSYSPILRQWVCTQDRVAEFITLDSYVSGQHEADELREFFTLDTESCDVIVTFDTFNRFEDDITAMRELNRILKKDGFLIVLNSIGIGITETLEYALIDAEERVMHWAVFGGEHNRRCYASYDLIDRLIDNGFYVGMIDNKYLSDDLAMNVALPNTFKAYICTKNPEIRVGVPENKAVFDGRKKVSFIVLSNGNPDELKKTIEDIRNQIYPTTEIVVVADMLTEEEKEIIDKSNGLKICLVELGVSSRSQRNNAGIEKTDGEYLVFTTAGVSYNTDFVYGAAALLESDKNIEFVYADERRKEKVMGAARIWPDVDIDKSRTSGDIFYEIAKSFYPALSTVVIRRNSIYSYGKFDEGLGNAGEKEFLLRLLDGRKAAEIPKVLVTSVIDRDNPFEDIGDRIDELLKICSEFDLAKRNKEVYVSVIRSAVSTVGGYSGTDRNDITGKIYERVKADKAFDETDLCNLRRSLGL